MNTPMATPWYIVNVEVALLHNGRYLAITRSLEEELGGGDVSIPGGKVDLEIPATDILETTARREVREETGLEMIEPIVYVESHTFGTLRTPVLDVVMLARATEAEITLSPEEVDHAEWLTLNEMLSQPLVQSWTKESLKRADTLRRQLGW